MHGEAAPYIRVHILGGSAGLVVKKTVIPDLLATSGCSCALAASWELPCTTLEAMMSSRPVVASSVGGIAEPVGGRATGCRVSPNG